jgi:putative flippase GtrA
MDRFGHRLLQDLGAAGCLLRWRLSRSRARRGQIWLVKFELPKESWARAMKSSLLRLKGVAVGSPHDRAPRLESAGSVGPTIVDGLNEFLRFLMSGGLAAAVNLGSAWAFRSLVGPGHFVLEISVALGFVVGTSVSFFLNRSFTFRVRQGHTGAQFIRFCAVGIVSSGFAAGLANRISVLLQHSTASIRSEPLLNNVAHAATIAVMTIANFFLIKYVAFAQETLQSNEGVFEERR